MITANEREEAFRRELDELLTKHGAELTIGDDGKPYGRQAGIATVTMDDKWDSGEVTHDWCDFEI